MKKSFTLLAALVATSFANDARVNALANSEMFNDASNMFRNPAYISQYKIIEGNITGMPQAGEEYVASGIGTWHVTENFMLGGYYNENEERAPLFSNYVYTDTLGVKDTVDLANPARKNVPHLLLGVKLGEHVTLGLDGSFEGSIDKDETDGRIIKDQTTVIGAKLGTVITTQSVDIDVAGGLYLPSSKSTDSKFPNTATTTVDTTFAENKGLEVFADARATVKFDEDFRLLAGFNFDVEKVEDKKRIKPQTPKETMLGFTIGTAKDFENDMTLGLSANFISGKRSFLNTENVLAGKAATFKASAEKTFNQTKLFDTHSFRIGYAHTFSRISTVTDGDIPATAVKEPNTESKYAGEWADSAFGGNSDIGLSLGAGMTRGKFGLDLFVSSGDFNFADQNAGILGLMPVAGATLTMDFAKKGTTLRSEAK